MKELSPTLLRALTTNWASLTPKHETGSLIHLERRRAKVKEVVFSAVSVGIISHIA